MIVYRLERPSGLGPFRLRTLDDEETRLAIRAVTRRRVDFFNTSALCPMPHEDVTPLPEYNYACGCASEAQIRYWFDGLFSPLAELGYFTSIYYATQFAIGHSQVLFNRETAMLLDRKVLV